jgi:predicted transport protein
MEKIGKEAADNIEWGGTRLICIAADFNKYDEHAVRQINRNIELMRYRYFSDNLLLLELVNAQTTTGAAFTVDTSDSANKPIKVSGRDKTLQERLAIAPPGLVELYDSACGFIEQLGDEVQRKELKLYTAFKRIRNFASIVVEPGRDARLLLMLKLPGDLAENNSFSRDVSQIGHWGTGDLELNIRTLDDWAKAQSLVQRAYKDS